ncbi:MAG: hypothetical protein A3G24_04500 [Betaproteobacteria bacterium RIFCSPLOWO2_12_FULL_62_13]|nr:MAG: hypothetical protein A3G24_04500 [Betaproteobacteria bacterium RIFCSPLOWO2_12_FULL_62_13]
MSNLTTQQLAEILLGIARAQQAIIDAMENSKAGFKSTHFRPMLETASRVRSNRVESLTDYPSRLLLMMLGRTGPDLSQVVKDLEALLSQQPTSAEAPVANTYAPAVDPDSLDMT